jgi:hypothetical protein
MSLRNFAQIDRSRVMAFLGEVDAHPYGQNDLAVKIEKSTLHAPKVTVSKVVDGLIRRKRFGGQGQ